MLKLILRLALLALILAGGWAVYALIADLPPPTRAVELDIPGARLK